MTPLSKSKLGELLSSLSKKEKRGLIAFSSIPYFRLKDYEIEVLKYLVNEENITKWNSQTLLDIREDLPSLEEVILKNSNYISSNLFKVVQQFVTFEIIQDQPLLTGHELIEYYHQKKLSKNLKAQYNKMISYLNKGYHHSSDYYWHKYKLSKVLLYDDRLKRISDTRFEDHIKNLDDFYLENRLRLLCEQLNRKEVINNAHSPQSSDLIVKHFNPQGHESIVARLYYHIYTMLSDIQAGLHHFHAAASQLSLYNKQNMPPDDARTVLDYLLNYSIQMINSNVPQGPKEYLNLIRFAEKTGLLLYHGALSPNRFKNTISCGILENDNVYMNEFVDRYQNLLTGEYSSHIINYNLANIELHQGRAERALELLYGFLPYDLYSRISFEKLLLKIYISLEDNEAAFKRIRSFRRYINNNTSLTQVKKNKVSKFISCIRDLALGHQINLEALRVELQLLDVYWIEKHGG